MGEAQHFTQLSALQVSPAYQPVCLLACILAQSIRPLQCAQQAACPQRKLKPLHPSARTTLTLLRSCPSPLSQSFHPPQMITSPTIRTTLLRPSSSLVPDLSPCPPPYTFPSPPHTHPPAPCLPMTLIALRTEHPPTKGQSLVQSTGESRICQTSLMITSVSSAPQPHVLLRVMPRGTQRAGRCVM